MVSFGVMGPAGGRPAIAKPIAEMPSGTTLGKYDILRMIATGGMAEIYLARQRGQAGFEKLVVLKRILPQVAADPTFVKMFLEEAKLAATLRHPHIADVWEVDCIDGMYFYTMEYIHGQDVRAIRAASRKRNERMPLAIAVGIVAAVAEALEYAHDRRSADGSPLQLVHRDISASNILVSYAGAVKLLDFGIAHAADRSDNTRTGSIKGKIPYMSPEQCQGQRLDRRSDLFSLGTVLYELTVGHRPYRGSSDFMIMEQIVRNDAPRPSQLDPSYPAPLEDIVMRLLARDLDARYQSAEQLIADLEQFQTSHQLWVSTKVISRFMRSLFWDNIEAWEKAVRDGNLDHLTAIDIADPRPEAVTPPSAFPVATAPSDPVAPAVAAPVEMRTSTPNVAPPDAVPMPFGALPEVSGPVAAVRSSAPAISPPVAAAPPPTEAPIDSSLARSSFVASEPAPAPTRSSKRVIAIAAGVVLLGVAIGVIAATSKSHAPAASSTPGTSSTTETTPSITPAPPTPPATTTATMPTVESAPTKPTPAPGPTPQPQPTIDPDRIELEPASPPVATPHPTTSSRPVVHKRKPAARPSTIKLKPEESTWDPNSPVLPQRH